MEEILGQILGFIMMILCVINTQFPKRWQMLLCSALVNLFSSLNQLFVGAGLTACFLCAVATVHCAINSYKAKKEFPEKLWEKILFIILYFMQLLHGYFAILFCTHPLSSRIDSLRTGRYVLDCWKEKILFPSLMQPHR